MTAGSVAITYSRGELTIASDLLIERDPESMADARARMKLRSDLLVEATRRLHGAMKGSVEKRAYQSQITALQLAQRHDKRWVHRAHCRLEAAKAGVWHADRPEELLARAYGLLMECNRRLMNVGVAMHEDVPDWDAIKNAIGAYLAHTTPVVVDEEV